ncbi:MAG: NTP/NDP exchange transporter [Rickettsiaceae bacterium]|nr:NTP/NDP exchange transporter [Rickettsiaceae bacterium]
MNVLVKQKKEGRFYQKFKDIIWPIKREESKKFFSIATLLFCILFIQNIIRALKDGIVTTQIGAETISFLKFWGVMPASLLIIAIYVKLVHKFKGTTIFYFTISGFLVFFTLFALVIFPNSENFHLSKTWANELVVNYPRFKWFILLLSNWSFSLFYVIVELWPNTVLSLLAWQFINSITTVEQSKRFYILFGVISQLSLVLAGLILANSAQIKLSLFGDMAFDNDKLQVQFLLSFVVLFGLIALAVFWYLNNRVFTKESYDFIIKPKAKKTSIMESLKLIWNSKYIRLITLLLICYGASINLVEGPWKARTSSVYTTIETFTSFTGLYLFYTGICTISMVIIGSNVVRKIGWAATASITPVIMFVTGIFVFISSSFQDALFGFIVLIDPINIAIIAGVVQNVLTKSSKYALFDATKEMVYVPLDHETKTKGKAAADMLGVKFGKSLGSAIQVFLLMQVVGSGYASYSTITSTLMVIFTIFCMIWFYSIYELNNEYSAKLKQTNNLNE